MVVRHSPALSIAALLSVFAAACGGQRGTGLPTAGRERVPRAQTRPIALTYLGVAGWEIEASGKRILVDPYFSRPPDLGAEITSDAAAVAARAPATADLILVGHSHVDHMLDVPAVSKKTGADILGSETTARIARSLGVADDKIITVKGGEDFAFDEFSVRVMPSLHSALGDKHVFGATAAGVLPPRRFDDWPEGGTFNYLLRIAGQEVFISSTANFIERELEGLRPDIAIIAPGLREEIHDYTCRLLRVLGNPPVVYATHFDNWRAAPVYEPPDDDLRAFVAEVKKCSPATSVTIPRHFERMTM